jgi:thioredoxin-related protein
MKMRLQALAGNAGISASNSGKCDLSGVWQRLALGHVVCWLLVCWIIDAAAFTQQTDRIAWRTQYAQARREAREKHLPLLLDFTTEWCVHCRRMDATTFQDPTIVALVNSRFVPAKIDASREQALVEMLRIRGYPTLVLALPDGRILHTLEGYVDAGQLKHYLDATLAALGERDAYAQALESALRDQQAGHYAQAIAALKKLLADPQALSVHQRARMALNELEALARQEQQKLASLETELTPQERELLYQDLSQRFAGTVASQEAQRALSDLIAQRQQSEQQRLQLANALLASARLDYEQQNWLACLERCDRLLREFADLPQAQDAQRLLEQLKSQPERMHTACERVTERLGELQLTLAESWLRQGEPQLAIETFRKVLIMFPDTRYAELARRRLQHLAEGPFQPTQFSP